MSLFSPNQYLSSVLMIDLDDLSRRGKKALIVDLDNTLLPRDIDFVPEEFVAWGVSAKEKGFSVCLVSNNWHERVFNAANQLGFDLVSKAVKPLPPAFLTALRKMGVTRKQTVVIGDQLFTDITGGNLLGMETIMVLPLAKYDLAHTLFLRKVERFFLKNRQPTR